MMETLNVLFTVWYFFLAVATPLALLTLGLIYLCDRKEIDENFTTRWRVAVIVMWILWPITVLTLFLVGTLMLVKIKIKPLHRLLAWVNDK